VFPEGIMYNKQKGVVRTPRVNSLFEAIAIQSIDSSKNKKADSSKNRLQSNKVPFAELSSKELWYDVKLALNWLHFNLQRSKLRYG
jgi:hypothetical protein